MVLLVLLLFCVLVNGTPVPQQVHLAFHGDTSYMNVAWITHEPDNSTVQWGTSQTNMPYSNTGSNKAWVFSGVTRYSHRALMSGLLPNTRYCEFDKGSRIFADLSPKNKTWELDFGKRKNEKGDYRLRNRIFSFKTLGTNPQTYRACIFGDLGFYHGNSTASIIRNGLAGKFDFVVHIGDIAYDLHSDNGYVGDNFMNQMEPLLSTMPYMVIAGNHENDHLNFSNFQNRFWMPHNGYEDNQFYSFDLGPVHWVAVSTEYYAYFEELGTGPVRTMYNYLDKDLAAANANREKTPWIISYQHRPMYCSLENSDRCQTPDNELIRKGLGDILGLEPLYLKYGVDMGFWGHEHAYERNWPIARKTYWAGDEYLHDPPAPIYILSGSAGCHTPHSTFAKPWGYSAFRSDDYGYTILTVANATHIHLQQISLNNHEQPIDDIWISKSLTHVNSDALRKNIKGGNVAPKQRCNPAIPKCTMTLRQLNEGQ